MICRHSSHLTHRPSVRTFFSPEVSSSPDCRLNHVIRQLPVATTEYPATSSLVLSTGYRILVLDSPLRHHALLVRVFDLAHFGDSVGEFDNCRMSIPSGQDYVHHLGPLLQRFRHFDRVQHAIADRVIDLVE